MAQSRSRRRRLADQCLNALAAATRRLTKRASDRDHLRTLSNLTTMLRTRAIRLTQTMAMSRMLGS